MIDDAVSVTSERPPAYGPEVTIRFFPEYSAGHPLWFWFDRPDLTALRLPAELVDRLRRWSDSWNDAFHWDDGWPPGMPEQWWTEEEARLPRDVALALGSDFVIEVQGQYVCSTRGAGSPRSAAAVHALIDAEIAERQHTRADITAGATYDAVAGDAGYRAWLAHRQSDPRPT